MSTDHSIDHANEAIVKGAELLKAMAHPLRLSLLAALVDEPKCVHELVDSSGSTQPLVSQHLRVLRGANLVRSERRGREVVYTVADTHIHHIVVDAVDHVRTEGDHHDSHVHDA